MESKETVEINFSPPTPNFFIDPSYPDYYGDRLFDVSDAAFNRDDSLVPFSTLRDALRCRGVQLHTADFLLRQNRSGELNYYYSLGMQGYRQLHDLSNVVLRAFAIMEPPIIAKHLYAKLPELTSRFDAVYVHNCDGDGYSLKGVDRSKLRRLDWPLPYNNVNEPYWSAPGREPKIVVINGHHRPGFRRGELYSERIRAVVALARLGAVDLFGAGWNKLFGRQSVSLAYLRNRGTLLRVYRGSCQSKSQVLSRYDFSLCIENQAMNGYISEKIFDCIYAGAIPIYIGAKDVLQYIPGDAFVDGRAFGDWTEMWTFLRSMSRQQRERIREAGRAFLSGAGGQRFYNSLQRMFGIIDN